MNQASFVPGKRNYLFYANQDGMEILQPIIDSVIARDLPYEIFPPSEKLDPEAVYNWLRIQKMGTFLYIAAEWGQLKKLQLLAEEVGFSKDEAKYIGYGTEQMNVFCCRCHGIMLLEKRNQSKITCSHCDLLLEVSSHYSELRDAYLGYVAKL